jgi:hypothetical protein
MTLPVQSRCRHPVWIARGGAKCPYTAGRSRGPAKLFRYNFADLRYRSTRNRHGSYQQRRCGTHPEALLLGPYPEISDDESFQPLYGGWSRSPPGLAGISNSSPGEQEFF